jgi:hypothetical protein
MNMQDIDLYEFKETIGKLSPDWERFIEVAYEKTVGFVLVGNPQNPPDIEKRLREQGFSDGDNVLVLIQD